MLGRLPVKGDFARNVVTLMTGTTMAQALPVAISPILTRLYSPDDFGLLAIFIALTSILGAIANGRYELAIMLPEVDEDAVNIAALGLLIATVWSALLMLIIVLLNKNISQLLGNKAIEDWLYFVPIVVWLTGFFNVLNYFSNRLKSYRDIAVATMYKSVVLACIQLVLGYFKAGAGGLIGGQLASSLFANGILFKRVWSVGDLRKVIGFTQMKTLAFRYCRFPIYSMPAILANSLSQNLVSILISTYYSVATLGFYSLVQRVLGMPSSLVGAAIGQVFFQKANEEKNKTGKAIKTFDSTSKLLALLALPVFISFYFFAEDAFSFIFGESWRAAGEYAKILSPFFAIRFIVASLSTLNSVFERQALSLAWQIFLLIGSIGIVLFAGIAELSFNKFLFLFCIFGLFAYALLYALLYMVSRGKL